MYEVPKHIQVLTSFEGGFEGGLVHPCVICGICGVMLYVCMQEDAEACSPLDMYWTPLTVHVPDTSYLASKPHNTPQQVLDVLGRAHCHGGAPTPGAHLVGPDARLVCTLHTTNQAMIASPSCH
jgi:hypothetical protein